MYARVQAVRQKLGPAGFPLAVIALIFALAGGAYAASGGLTQKQKKQVEGIAKKYAGQDGAPGAAGQNGAPGKDGASGKDGADGTDGANGKTVLSGSGAPSAGTGTDGDFYIRTATSQIWGPKTAGSWGSPTNLQGADGINGSDGVDGQPWTPDNQLPAGASETGTVVVSARRQSIVDGNMQTVEVGPTNVATSISFPIQLAAPLDNNHVRFVDEFGSNPDPTNCTGSMGAPTAAPGYLCVYGFALNGAFATLVDPSLGGIGASVAGAEIAFSVDPSSIMAAVGTWAVTGPTS